LEFGIRRLEEVGDRGVNEGMRIVGVQM